jgi:uncharacterized SAM-binding protein YcdF (DUF218 family)
MNSAEPYNGAPLDVLVVLGYNCDPNNPVTRGRVARAVELFQQGAAPRLIMSGCCSFKLAARPVPCEAEVMRDIAIAMGVPAAAILIEDESADTLGNAVLSKVRHILPNGWRKVGVVSTDVHMVYGGWLFEKALAEGYEVVPFSYDGHSHMNDERYALQLQIARTQLAEYQAQVAAVANGDHEALRAFMHLPPPRLPPAD